MISPSSPLGPANPVWGCFPQLTCLVAVVGTTLAYPIVTESAVTHVVSVGNPLANFLARRGAAGEDPSSHPFELSLIHWAPVLTSRPWAVAPILSCLFTSSFGRLDSLWVPVGGESVSACLCTRT